jgi:hypothetical protein
MLTVKEFKELGVPFVKGDVRTSSTCGHGDVEMTWQLAYGTNLENDVDHESIKSFAWRPLNMLPDNPKFKYEVDINAHSWRPLLEQSVKTDNKPVFTQAMADADYAPEAGCYCEIMLAGYWQKCFIVGMSKKGNPVIELGEHCTESIGCNYRALDTRTPKQKAVDAASLTIEMKHGSAGSAYKKYCETLYDAGLLKTDKED